jgi:steroid 5-alpha reductase family enzyme
MFDVYAFVAGLGAVLAVGVVGWVASLPKGDVSIVDSLWSLMFLATGLTYVFVLDKPGVRTALILLLVSAWAIRLSAYITWRNWGKPEDYRYRRIRQNNEPYFTAKSLFIVFWLQGALAAIISLPLLAAINSATPVGWIDIAGITLWLAGMVFEAGGDWQLARFKADPANEGRVMDKGLWRYTRHPNYFGNACIWWGFYLIALSAGGWWSVVSPLLMTFLLLRVSGVAMLEKDIGERRPGYTEYVARTNAFIPGPPRKPASEVENAVHEQ